MKNAEMAWCRLKRLNELMAEAQKEAYGDALNTVHPHFWASKLHFYITGVQFYNFPYTFGYLFSLSIYAKALEDGEGFEQKYMALFTRHCGYECRRPCDEASW